MWVHKRQDLQRWCDHQHWWKICTTKHCTTQPGQQRILRWLIRTVLRALLGQRDSSETNVICIVYCQKGVKQPFFSQQQHPPSLLSLENDLSKLCRLHLNQIFCVQVGLRAFNFEKWENCGYLLWDYEACTWWILYRDFKNSKNPTSLSSPTFPLSTTYHIWPLLWNPESVYLQSDMRSLKFSVKGKLFPHYHFLVALEIGQIIYAQILFGDMGGESLPASIVLSKLKHIPVALWMRHYFQWRQTVSSREKKVQIKNPQLWQRTSLSHKSARKYACLLQQGTNPLKTCCKVSTTFNQLFLQQQLCFNSALQKSRDVYHQLQRVPRQVSSTCFWNAFLCIRRRKMTTLD